MAPVNKGKEVKGQEKVKQVKKTVEKIRMVKRKNEQGEEEDEETEEKYTEEIEVDAEGEQPEENRMGELSGEVKQEQQLTIATQDYKQMQMEGVNPRNLEAEIKKEEETRKEQEELERRTQTQERRKTMTDAEIMKEEGWKLSEIWDKETRDTAIYMARGGAQGITNFIKKGLQRATEDIDNKKSKYLEKQKEQTGPRRNWTSKKNQIPDEYSTPKRITDTGDIINTARKTKEETKRFEEMERKMQKQIDELTARLQAADMGEDNTAARVQLQEVRMEKAETMMKQQQKINEVMNTQVKYLMKAEIAEDRRKSERQALVRGWTREISEDARDQWIKDLLVQCGFNTDKSDYKSEILDIQHSSYKGFSNMSIITFREPWQTRKFIDFAKTKTLKFYIQEQRYSKSSGSNWDNNGGWNQNQQWDSQQGNTQQTWGAKQYQGKTVFIKVAPQLAKFDRTQQLYLRSLANVYNLWFNRVVKMEIDWKGFQIFSQDEELGIGKQLGQLVFSRDGEVGVFSDKSVNDAVAELFHSAMNLANNGTKFTWEREGEENQWEKDWRTGVWIDHSELGQFRAKTDIKGMNEEERNRLIDLTLETYPKMPYSERSQLPWRPYFCTVEGDEFFKSLKEGGDGQDWVKEGKEEWDNWKWNQQGKTFNWQYKDW